MKTRTRLMTLAVLFAAVTVCYAADSTFMGTWKLNEAKSKMSPGMGKNSTVVYAADGDNMKITVDGTSADGKATHNEWTGKFDGKDYAVSGDAANDMRSYTRLNAHTLRLVSKKDGKVTMSGRIVVTADGKSRTVTESGTENGKKMSVRAVYDKE